MHTSAVGFCDLADERQPEAITMDLSINDLLRTILTTDHEDSALLSARKRMVAGDLSTLAGGRTANAAYAKSGAAATGVADITG